MGEATRGSWGKQARQTIAGTQNRVCRAVLTVGLVAGLLSLTGCNGFFVRPSTTTTTGTTTTNTGDYAYVANSSAGTTYLSEYNVGSGALTSLDTISLGYIPVALAVAPSNAFLYVASAPGFTSPGIYLYSIGSTGALTVANSGNALVTDTIAAIAVSPDGNWLFTISSTGLTMSEYSVNTSTGVLTLETNITLPPSTCTLSAATPVSQSCSVAVAPSGAYVVASLGSSGDAVFTYSSSGGLTGTTFRTISSGYSTSNPTGDFSVALDANNFAYIAQTSSVSVDAIGTSTLTNEGTVSYAAGAAPRSITLSTNYDYVYTANEGAGTISAFGIGANGALGAVANAPFAGPANVSALGVDNTGSYLVAVGYDASAGVRLYSIASTGVLTQIAAAGSGTSDAYPALVAMTH